MFFFCATPELLNRIHSVAEIPELQPSIHPSRVEGRDVLSPTPPTTSLRYIVVSWWPSSPPPNGHLTTKTFPWRRTQQRRRFRARLESLGIIFRLVQPFINTFIYSPLLLRLQAPMSPPVELISILRLPLFLWPPSQRAISTIISLSRLHGAPTVQGHSQQQLIS